MWICSECNAFQPKTLAAMNHLNDISYKNLNDISYKSPDVDVSFGFIKNSSASNIDKETIKDFIVQLFLCFSIYL